MLVCMRTHHIQSTYVHLSCTEVVVQYDVQMLSCWSREICVYTRVPNITTATGVLTVNISPLRYSVTV